MVVEIGQGLALFLGSVVTTAGGVIILVLTNKGEFRKAEQARKHSREDATEAARINKEELAKLVTEDGAKKDQALKEIHTLANDRLTAALAKIEDLQKTVYDLVHASGALSPDQKRALGSDGPAGA